MDQVSFVDALLPAGFGRNARLERIAKLIDWAPIERLVAEIHPGETGRAETNIVSLPTEVSAS
jgi:IS5 family transposase